MSRTLLEAAQLPALNQNTSPHDRIQYDLNTIRPETYQLNQNIFSKQQLE